MIKIDDLENLTKEMFLDMVKYRNLVKISPNFECKPILDLQQQYMLQFNIDEDDFMTHYSIVNNHLLPKTISECEKYGIPKTNSTIY